MQLPDGISIVICTYNGVSRLQPTLKSIFSLQTDSSIPWELIIIDNASTDSTFQFCEDFIIKNGFTFNSKVVHEALAGCNHARLRGLREAKYKWLLFCDDDNHLFPDYIQKGWEILQNNTSIGVLGGQGIPLFESTKPDWFDKYSISFAIGAQNTKEGKLQDTVRKLYSAGSFFRKEALMYYYDTNFLTIMVGPKGNELTRGEDTEWCMMIELLGYDMWYSSKLKFFHYMTVGRMQWSYYLRLKEGIASGVAKFEPYTLFLNKYNPSIFSFLIIYFRNTVFSQINWLQFYLRSRVQPKRYSIEHYEIGSVVNRMKATSYRTNFRMAFHHFLQLKKVLLHSKNTN
jgi:glycosyltransferase involved in cell wall biosynthesis